MSAWCSIRDSRIAGRVFSAQVGLYLELIGDYLLRGDLLDQLAVFQHDKARIVVDRIQEKGLG